MASGTFTELCEQIEIDNANKVANHPLYVGLAKGSLSMECFKGFIQQEVLLVEKYVSNCAVMMNKEIDPARKELLKTVSAEIKGVLDLMASCFEEFDFKAVTIPETYTQKYIDLLHKSALYSSVGECLAAYYPSLILWYKAGVEMYGIAIYENNTYSRLLKALLSGDTSGLRQFKDFVNGYYERASASEKKMMLKYYTAAVQMELNFCNGCYIRNE